MEKTVYRFDKECLKKIQKDGLPDNFIEVLENIKKDGQKTEDEIKEYFKNEIRDDDPDFKNYISIILKHAKQATIIEQPVISNEQSYHDPETRAKLFKFIEDNYYKLFDLIEIDTHSTAIVARKIAETIVKQIVVNEKNKSKHPKNIPDVKNTNFFKLFQHIGKAGYIKEESIHILDSINTIRCHGNKCAHDTPSEEEMPKEITKTLANSCIMNISVVIEWYFSEYIKNNYKHKVDYDFSKFINKIKNIQILLPSINVYIEPVKPGNENGNTGLLPPESEEKKDLTKNILFVSISLLLALFLFKYCIPFTANLSNRFNLQNKEFSDKIALLTLDDKDYKQGDKTWRNTHAALIHQLIPVKPSAIVFDFILPGSSVFDDALIDAVKQAKEHDIHVMFVSKGGQQGLETDEKFKESGCLTGFACGDKSYLDKIVRIPLLIKRYKFIGSKLGGDKIPKYEYSLALEAVRAGKQGEGMNSDNIFKINGLKGIVFSEPIDTTEPDPSCKAVNDGDQVYELKIRLTDTDILRQSERYLYFDKQGKIYKSKKNENYNKDKLLETLDESSIIIVGAQPENFDYIKIEEDGEVKKRYGMELQADAVNAILTDSYIRFPSLFHYFLAVIISLAASILVLLKFKQKQVLLSFFFGLILLISCVISFIYFNIWFKAGYVYLFFIIPLLLNYCAVICIQKYKRSKT